MELKQYKTRIVFPKNVSEIDFNEDELFLMKKFVAMKWANKINSVTIPISKKYHIDFIGYKPRLETRNLSNVFICKRYRK